MIPILLGFPSEEKIIMLGLDVRGSKVDLDFINPSSQFVYRLEPPLLDALFIALLTALRSEVKPCNIVAVVLN